MTLQTAAANASYGTTASGSSFYAAMRILPRDQREAMFQIYSFCRQVDDIADSEGYRRGFPLRRALVDLDGARTALWVALRKDGRLRAKE